MGSAASPRADEDGNEDDGDTNLTISGDEKARPRIVSRAGSFLLSVAAGRADLCGYHHSFRAFFKCRFSRRYSAMCLADLAGGDFHAAGTVVRVHRRHFFNRRLPGDLAYYFISSFIPALMITPVMGTIIWAAHRYGPWSYFHWIGAQPFWLRVILSLAVAEVGFYWGHRWLHEVPFLWRFHKIHHEPTEVYFLISARAHPIDNVFNKLCGFIPVYALGIMPAFTLEGGAGSALIVIGLMLWGFLIHSNIRCRLGPLEWLISMPAFHLWHHSFQEPRNRNFAPTFPVVDWIFGTFYLPKHHPAQSTHR